MNNHLHIISFNVPFPADYGGVMDVFYKIKALNKIGYKITLHCFQYGRKEENDLRMICEDVYYYHRKTGILSQFSLLPYIIYSRRSKELLQNLMKDNDPIIFEGLHTTYYIKCKCLAGRKKIIRTHNIEHSYYWHLFLSEKSPGSKIFFLLESIKLFFGESRIRRANYLATISEKDFRYFQHKFGNAFLLNAFHSSEKIECISGKGGYLLFHANLSVPENIKAVIFLIDEVFSKIPYPVMIAGKEPSKIIAEKIEKHDHIHLTKSPVAPVMHELIRKAHATILFSFQPTGTKLKLLESLFYGRHCIINSHITDDAKLIELCKVADTSEQIISAIHDIMVLDFDTYAIEERKRILTFYDNETGAKVLKGWIEK